ncbi:MAG: DUF551 domain-containing protein [Bacteroidales bacterium]|nr:DUF551 domain-containing protein [Candidatus Scybalousia scybalohippi]
MVHDFTGFERGVIGRKMYSDKTLNNMRKEELIKLLHTAEHNYETLNGFYANAVRYNEQNIPIPKWIPCSERLPEDGDSRFYMCTVENHEEDLPMFCQYEEESGFGFWHDIYDEHTLGFVDSEFMTNEELGYEKVIAWMQLPEHFKECD